MILDPLIGNRGRPFVLAARDTRTAGRTDAGLFNDGMSFGRLLRLLVTLPALVVITTPLRAQKMAYPFTAGRAGEAVAEITLSSPGANWATEGHEAALADVRVDDGPVVNVMLYAGAQQHTYSVFLGALAAGAHRLTIERNRQYSAANTSVSVEGVQFRSGESSAALAHAPILFARQNTVGKFTDIPMVVYAEELREGGETELQYTVIFTNEDGGTSTRALMARWGRSTDIEYVYRVNPRTHRATMQGRDHKEVEFRGKREGFHPLLIPVTDNNMIGDEAPSPIRYQIAPVIVDLSAHSREQVMDDHPFTYRVMSEELHREGKLRRFGVVDGEKISDPRNYVYLEAKVGNRNSGVSVAVRLRGDSVWRSADIGRVDYAISRDGWVRTTVELPPGTQPGRIAEIGIECVVYPGPERRLPLAGDCRVETISKAFLLDQNYKPGPPLFTLLDAVEIPSGQMRTFAVK